MQQLSADEKGDAVNMNAEVPEVDAPPPRSTRARNREIVAGFCTRHHVQKLSVIHNPTAGGSRSSHGYEMLVEFEPHQTPGRFALVAMEIELSTIAGQRVDLRTYDELIHHTSQHKLDQSRVVYSA